MITGHRVVAAGAVRVTVAGAEQNAALCEQRHGTVSRDSRRVFQSSASGKLQKRTNRPAQANTYVDEIDAGAEAGQNEHEPPVHLGRVHDAIDLHGTAKNETMT